MTRERKPRSWHEMYEFIRNDDGTVDIVLPRPRREQKSIRLLDYQVQFLIDEYPAEFFSDSLRMALDDLIKMRMNANRILIITGEDVREKEVVIER